MSLKSESVTLPGSGLVFINYYSDNVTEAYRSAILRAEDDLQSHFTDAVTIAVRFDYSPLSGSFSGQNVFNTIRVSYADFTAALRAHAVTADDLLAVNGLPASDPSQGAGFAIATGQAVILGLASQTNIPNLSVTLNSSLNFSFGQDAVGVLQHEITEGAFGRFSSLGLGGSGAWQPMDLFRFNLQGQRDYTGGANGVTTYFGLDGAHLSAFAFHNSIDASGANDGFDLADWQGTFGDAFGPGGPSAPGRMSFTDLQVLDVLGLTPTGAGRGFTPAPDDFASSLGDAAHPAGALTVGGAVAGVLEKAGDRDWFAVQLQAGETYLVTQTGKPGGAGTVADTFLRLHDASGALVAANDDIVSGTNPDSQLMFTATATGAYYVEAGGYVDGYTGSYRVAIATAAAPAGGVPGTVLAGAAGGDSVQGAAGDDTINGGDGGANYLRGNGGADVINGGAGFDDANGNMGDDTVHGGAGDDYAVGGKDNDLLFGDSGNDIVWGNLGNDTQDGGDGNDQVRGGQGDDTITGGAGDDFVSGDRGNDTIAGGSGADRFHGSQDAGIDRIVDFNLAEGDRVQLDPGTTYTLSQVGADTVLDMGGGNQMILVGVQMSTLTGGWVFTG